MANYTKCFTLTGGDVAENHKGMQKIGEMAQHGFTKGDLDIARQWFADRGCDTQIIKLHNRLPRELREDNKAYVLIVKNGVNTLLDSNEGANNIYNEQDMLEKDTKAFMYGRVVNKHARHNLCFSDIAQQPNYMEGMGTIVAFNSVPLLNTIRERLGEALPAAMNLQFEGNYYHDVKACGIGWHGDSERFKVVGIRLGASIPLVYCWFHNNVNITPVITMPLLEHGDIYFMSHKATGNDWKRKTQYTLRHAAGANKYIQL